MTALGNRVKAIEQSQNRWQAWRNEPVAKWPDEVIDDFLASQPVEVQRALKAMTDEQLEEAARERAH